MTVGRYIPGLVAVGAILAFYKIFDVAEVIHEFSKKEVGDKYDVIIVGGGIAGSTLASRISEDSDIQVLLLEAGAEPHNEPNIDIPIMADTLRGSSFDWGYQTVPQKFACKSHVNQSAKWTMGKGLGGTSNINYLLYLRGSRHDYDSWSSNGAHGWAYKDVLPYFIKSEDQRNGEFVRTVFHGFGGRMTVSDICLSPITKALENAFKELGIKKRDINGRVHFGFSNVQATIRNGLRWGTYRAFLKRAVDRPNLTIVTRAVVQKITFEGRKATGVIYKHNGQQKIVKATKEVVVSAGIVGSTKLLLLSGIGPRSHLQNLKIPVISDVPVGDNLQDQVMADGIEYHTPYGGITITPAKAENFLSSWAYTLFGTGLKQSPRFREAVAYVRTHYQPPHIKYPLIALYFLANIDPYEAHMLNIKEEAWEVLHAHKAFREGITIYPVLLHPISKGTIRLKSNNPDDDVLINPNYLAEDADVKILAEAFQFARKLVTAEALRNWDMTLNNNLLPQCEKYGNFTIAYIECFLHHITLSGNAPVGTCKMGAAGDPTAVVDPTLRVRGTKNLRVVDSCVIPSSLSGDTYATEVMIAEKAADMIRDKDTVKAIKDYFKHLSAIKHKRFEEEHDAVTTGIETGAKNVPHQSEKTKNDVKQGKKKMK